MSDVILKVDSLNAWYGRAQVLFNVGLDVRRGEVVALMGRNGAGKSTAMKAVMGLLERRRGDVHFMGKDISSLEPFRIARLGLGFVPENRRIFTDLTVLENLEIGRQPPRAVPPHRPCRGGQVHRRSPSPYPRRPPPRRARRSPPRIHANDLAIDWPDG